MTIVLLTVVPLLQWTDRSVESRSILRNLAERSTRNKAPQGVFAKFDLLPILGVEFAPQQAIFTHACVYKLVLCVFNLLSWVFGSSLCWLFLSPPSLPSILNNQQEQSCPPLSASIPPCLPGIFQ